MLLTVSIPLPMPRVGAPFGDRASVVSLIVMVPRISWPAIASRKTELGSSMKPWKLAGYGPVLWEVGATVSCAMLTSGTLCSLPSGAIGWIPTPGGLIPGRSGGGGTTRSERLEVLVARERDKGPGYSVALGSARYQGQAPASAP